MADDGLIRISEMAALHGISRQALILYDKNDLLKPVRIAENGYRYYSLSQIPRLRMICLLKSMGVPLSQVASFLDSPTTDMMNEVLARRTAEIDAEIERLRTQQADIAQYSENFEHIDTFERATNIPSIEWLPERKVIFAPYPSHEMDHKRLHLTLMDAMGKLIEAGVVPSQGFGSLLKVGAVMTDEPLTGAGSIVFLPHDVPIEGAEVRTISAGEYAVMYKRAMPYDVEPARKLLAWMREHDLTPTGDVVDRCLLDATFYDDHSTADFCRLAIRIAN